MLPVIKGKDLVAFLETLGFTVIRQRGSHKRMKSDDGRYTSVPVHSGEDIPKGLFAKDYQRRSGNDSRRLFPRI
jgi:predicted RNA binding protein YcfA (HicA-like mRNA interferase family)